MGRHETVRTPQLGERIALYACLTALTAFSIDAMLPGLPLIETALAPSPPSRRSTSSRSSFSAWRWANLFSGPCPMPPAESRRFSPGLRSMASAPFSPSRPGRWRPCLRACAARHRRGRAEDCHAGHDPRSVCRRADGANPFADLHPVHPGAAAGALARANNHDGVRLAQPLRAVARALADAWALAGSPASGDA